VTLAKDSKPRDGGRAIGAPVVYEHCDVVDVGLRGGMAHDSLHEREPCVLRIGGSAAGRHGNQGGRAMGSVEAGGDERM
jgi:hypothetical protein